MTVGTLFSGIGGWDLAAAEREITGNLDNPAVEVPVISRAHASAFQSLWDALPLPWACYARLEVWERQPDRTQADVLALFDRAIAEHGNAGTEREPA